MQTFTLDQVLNILKDWDQTLNPDDYPETKEAGLGTEDFSDAALCKAQELGIESEYTLYIEKQKVVSTDDL